MGDRSPMSQGGERYSPQRSYTQSRSRSPDGRGRSYTPDRDDKVGLAPRVRSEAFCVWRSGSHAAPLPRMHVDRRFAQRPTRLLANLSPKHTSRSVLQVSTIYVGGISFDTDERALQNYFSKFGTVTEVKVRRCEPACRKDKTRDSQCRGLLLSVPFWQRPAFQSRLRQMQP